MTQEIDTGELIDRASKLAEREGIPLSEAMSRVEDALARPAEAAAMTFTITFTVKRRIAKFLRAAFPPTSKHSTEDRLGAFMPYLLGRLVRENKAMLRPVAEVHKGGAVTVRGSLDEGGGDGAQIDMGGE